MGARTRLVWRCAWISVLAALYGAVGLASSGIAAWAGTLGAVAIISALVLVLVTRPRPAAVVVLGAAVLPLALVTWTSLVTPLLAALCLVLGWPLGGRALRRTAGADHRVDDAVGANQ